jgi:hypothetical protein
LHQDNDENEVFVIKFIDVTRASSGEANFNYELQIMDEIRQHNLEGFPRIYDHGRCTSELS